MKTLWEDDQVQFTRLLAEISSTELPNYIYDELRASMDLTNEEINELFDRANAAWERYKLQAR